MKVFYLFIGVLFTCLMSSSPVSAQLEVDSQGWTIFGNQPYTNGIFICDEYVSATARPFKIFRHSNGNVFLSRRGPLTVTQFGIALSPTGTTVAVGDNIPLAFTAQYSLQVYNSTSTNYGGIFVNTSGSSTGIRCDVSSGSPFVAYKGSQKIFEVSNNGNVYSATNYYTSDATLKKNIETISNPLEKVMLLRGVTFDLITPDAGEIASFDYEKEYEQIKAIVPEITPEIFRQIQEEKLRKQMGVIAQELEQVIPEVVRTREDGLKAVAYSELVGLLIEAIKEQQAKIERLESSVFPQELRSYLSTEETASLAPDETIAGSQLFQNMPNPFSVNTDIKYFLPVGIVSANMYIYDMQGKQIKSIPVVQRGEGAVQVQGSELSAGMYIYTLIADNKVVGTKRMILTE